MEDKEQKLRSLQIAIDQIEKQHGKGSIMKLGDGVVTKIECYPHRFYFT